MGGVPGKRAVDGPRAILALLAAVGAVLLAFACASPLSGDCSEDGTCAPGPGSDSGGTAIDGGGMDGGAGEGTSDAIVSEAMARDGTTSDAPVCNAAADPKDDPCVISEAYAVFVAPLVQPPGDAGVAAEGGFMADAAAGAEGGSLADASSGGEGGLPSDASPGGDAGLFDAGVADGTMRRPYPTIGQALAHLGGKKRVYVCNGVYAEAVHVETSVGLFGGFSCAAVDGGPSWAYVGGSAQVNSPSPTYALSVGGPAAGGRDAGGEAGTDAALVDGGAPIDVRVEDLSFTAPSATAPSGSSIAAFVQSASVHFARVALTAGKGADGLPGVDGNAQPNFVGDAPAGGGQILTSNLPAGGIGAVNVCLRYGSSVGGDGGTGCAGVGTPGTSIPPAPPTSGRDGLPLYSLLPDGGVAATNEPGADGTGNPGGLAASPQMVGVLTTAGWTPSAGSDGQPGNPGQGGAGATDDINPAGCGNVGSLGGGGGGAGGCGGAQGTSGGAGGGSVALAALEANVDLRAMALTAASAGLGGTGGAGQDGQPGAAGGDDATNSFFHTPGASGGNGAGGSGGAGGTGGISVCILYKDSSLVLLDTSPLSSARIGLYGAGGAPGAAGRYVPGPVITTGSNGNPGAAGTPGTSAVLLQLR